MFFGFRQLSDASLFARASVNFWQTGGLILQAFQFLRLRCSTKRRKLKQAGAPFRSY
jgi:hypothetical protein